MRAMTGAGVETLTATAPILRQAAELLADGLPPLCRPLVAYRAPRYSRYLAAALAPPPAQRTVILRGRTAGSDLVAVADWRLLPDALLLNGIAVRDGWRGRGLGGTLLADGERLARDLGLTDLLLDVAVDNEPARRLYQRDGFVDLAVSHWSWHGPRPGLGRTADRLRITDWPQFLAHYTEYGFADCTVRDAAGAVRPVRVVGDAVRADEPADVAVLSRLGAALPPVSLAYRVTSPDPDQPVGRAGPAFARFARMRRRLD